MLKFELRKLATVGLAIALVGMMAACSGSSSSTDDALSHPGDNYMGSLRFDVNPTAESVDVTPIGSPFVGTKIPGNNAGVIPNVTISTLPNGCRLANNQNNTSFARIIGVNANCTLTGATGRLARLGVGTMQYRAPGDTADGPVVNVAAGGLFTLQSNTANNSVTVWVDLPIPTVVRNDNNLNIQRNRNWNAGTGALDFNARITYNRTDRELYNVRIGPNSSTRMGVATTNSAKCSGVWSGCLPANDPAVTYVADSTADGPVTERTCNQAGALCTTKYKYNISAGCGSILAHWTLTEAAGLPYTFWADLYGDAHLITPLTSDNFYSENTASIFLRPRKMSASATVNPAEGADSNQMVPGEWFYVHYYVDQPGNNRALAYSVTPGVGDIRIEDTGNIAAWGGGTNSAANYWSTGQITWSVRFDPAIIELNASNTNDAPGNGGAKFNTVIGTALSRLYDANGVTDGWNMVAPTAALWSNKMGIVYVISTAFQAAVGGPFMDPCGMMPGNNCNAADGFANIDIDVGYVPLRVKPAAAGVLAGMNSPITVSYDSFTVIQASRTNAQPYNNGAWLGNVQGVRSGTWPTGWCSGTPGATCVYTVPGQFNTERSYICIM